MLATGAMLLRNSLILAILAARAFAYSLVPMLIMLAVTAILLRFGAGSAGYQHHLRTTAGSQA
jgi:hypothetical protein